MKQKVINLIIPLATILLCSGCGRMMEWTKTNFYQGEKLKKQFSFIPDYVRSVFVYDQFCTQGIFDALWLSDEVRTAYAESYAQRSGKSTEQKTQFLRRQLEENNQSITFIVLSLNNNPLGQSSSEWSVMMQIDDKHYLPTEIKQVDLCPDYKVFFGNRYNRFKTSYLVKFDVRDMDGNKLLHENVRQLILDFRSLSKDAPLIWNFDEKGLIVLPEHAYSTTVYQVNNPLPS